MATAKAKAKAPPAQAPPALASPLPTSEAEPSAEIGQATALRLLEKPEDAPSAPQRATAARTLQRQVGNARLGRLVAGKESPTTAKPHRPPRAPGSRSGARKTRPPATAAPVPAGPPQSIAAPPPALLLDDGGQRVPAQKLLRLATHAVLPQGSPGLTRTFRAGARRIEVDETLFVEPGARKIIERLTEAAEGHAASGNRSLSVLERLQALRDGGRQLDHYLQPQDLGEPEVLELHLSFEAAYAAQEQILLGLIAADYESSELLRPPALKGLAAPTMVNSYVVQQIDLLLPALDDWTKSVTTLTRLQAGELKKLGAKVLSALDAKVPKGFGFLASMVFLRATLNTIKGYLTAGDIVRGKKETTDAVVSAIQVPGKLLEGLLASLFGLLAVVQAARGGHAAARELIARYALTVGRGIVWTTAVAQLTGGLVNLLAVAFTDQKFKKVFFFDALYGGAGALAPLGNIAAGQTEKAIELEIERLFSGTLAEAEAAAQRLGTLIPRKQLFLRIASLAGKATGAALAVDLASQYAKYGVRDIERTAIGRGLVESLDVVESFGTEVSRQAVDLVHLQQATNLDQDARRKQASSAASTLFAFMESNLFALRYAHEPARRATQKSHPALGRRLAKAEEHLRRVDRSDPDSVLDAARQVLAVLRGIFRDVPQIYTEELQGLDQDRFFQVHAEEK